MKFLSSPVSLLLIFVLISRTSGSAHAESGAAEDVSLGRFPGAVWNDIRALPTWENTWWLLGGTALTIGVHQFEDPVSASEALNKGIWDEFSDFGNIWGDLRVQAPLALGTWGVGSWAGNDEVAGFGFDLSRGLLLTYTTTSILKAAVNRTRPNGDDYSFPSGHTAAAFTTAGVVTQRYGGWLGGVSIGLGVMTAMGRMEDMKHYASDVVAGATIGWIIGRTVARKDPDDETAWQVVPFGNGLAMIKSF